MTTIEQAADALKRGKVGIFPTETVYGLGASIEIPEAIREIFVLKGRPSDNPVIVHISEFSQAFGLIEELNESFFRLTERFWPGPLTVVVRKKEGVTDLISGGLPTIAIRMPSHPVAHALIAQAGPLAAPSANLSGKPSPTSLSDALEDLGGRVAFALDGGPCSIGIESTVISLVHPVPTLLRPGSITRSELEQTLHTPIALPPRQGPVLSPGMKYRHYAPKASLKLVYDEKELKGPVILRSMTPKQLYAELRRCDRENVEAIEIFCDASMRADPALMDRLLRAATP